MAKIDFFGPDLKVERAEHHINDLERIFDGFIADNVKGTRIQDHKSPLEPAATAALPTFPKHTPTVLGDAIHNLRAALDHAYCVLVEANGVTVTRNSLFPFGKDRQALEGSINGHKKLGITPTDKVCDAIVSEIQPFEGGAMGLYGLHKLDITDKHHVLIPTVARMEARNIRIENARGAIVMQGIRIEVPQSKGTGGQFVSVGGGRLVANDDPKDIFKICFEQGQPYAGASILETLRTIRGKVIEALGILKKSGT